MTKKVQVSFSDKQIELLSSFRGELGETDAEIVRNIVISWLSEKNIISSVAKKKLLENKIL